MKSRAGDRCPSTRTFGVANNALGVTVNGVSPTEHSMRWLRVWVPGRMETVSSWSSTRQAGPRDGQSWEVCGNWGWFRAQALLIHRLKEQKKSPFCLNYFLSLRVTCFFPGYMLKLISLHCTKPPSCLPSMTVVLPLAACCLISGGV